MLDLVDGCGSGEGTGYVLVTPVRNELAYLPRTVRSVLQQTVLPREWVIVSDGSTDGTDEFVREQAKVYPWIRLLRMEPRPHHSFAALVRNTETGIRAIERPDWEFLGLLDADVEFQADYFEQLLRTFRSRPRLGMAGGVVIDIGLPRTTVPRNREDIPGAVQFFRRKCLDAIGGLLPIPEGGWDVMTCVAARLHGFETALCTDLVVDHLKPRNVSQGGAVGRKWQLGVREYACGAHPCFMAVKCVSLIGESPIFVGAVARWFGYLSGVVTRRPRVTPLELVAARRREQVDRLWGIFGRKSSRTRIGVDAAPKAGGSEPTRPG